MADETPRLVLEYIFGGQDLQERRANSTFNLLDFLAMPACIDRDLDAPPGGEVDGDIYIVGSFSMAVDSINTGTKTITVTGDHTARLNVVGETVHWINSTDPLNNIDYTIVSATENGGNTDIVVNEAINSNTPDGTIEHADDEWNGHRNSIAGYYAGWVFAIPIDGFFIRVEDEPGAWFFWSDANGAWEIGVPLPVVAEANRPTSIVEGRLLYLSDGVSNPVQVQDSSGNWRDMDGNIVP